MTVPLPAYMLFLIPQGKASFFMLGMRATKRSCVFVHISKKKKKTLQRISTNVSLAAFFMNFSLILLLPSFLVASLLCTHKLLSLLRSLRLLLYYTQKKCAMCSCDDTTARISSQQQQQQHFFFFFQVYIKFFFRSYKATLSVSLLRKLIDFKCGSLT